VAGRLTGIDGSNPFSSTGASSDHSDRSVPAVTSTNPVLQCTMTKVGQSDGKGTFAGTRGNDEVAPIPDLPRPCPGTEKFDAE
jgi:hypothetical protein